MTCSALFFAGEVSCLRNPILDIGASRKLPEYRLHLLRRCPGQHSIRAALVRITVLALSVPRNVPTTCTDSAFTVPSICGSPVKVSTRQVMSP